mmetsp:Transcript_32939/g.97216  ORF Transcript_32939/g.97216 Transcript_32939/m.97216 type:complete len:220 (+) Transcript_32939:453-1112(+)
MDHVVQQAVRCRPVRDLQGQLRGSDRCQHQGRQGGPGGRIGRCPQEARSQRVRRHDRRGVHGHAVRWCWQCSRGCFHRWNDDGPQARGGCRRSDQHGRCAGPGRPGGRPPERRQRGAGRGGRCPRRRGGGPGQGARSGQRRGARGGPRFPRGHRRGRRRPRCRRRSRESVPRGPRPFGLPRLVQGIRQGGRRSALRPVLLQLPGHGGLRERQWQGDDPQ